MTQPEEWDEFIGANDFVLLVDQAKYWMIRVSDISTLEACGDYTRAHLRCATPPIRRPLGECERRLDPSLFFSCQRRLHRQPRANESNPHARSVSTCLCSPGLPRDFCFRRAKPHLPEIERALDLFRCQVAIRPRHTDDSMA